MDEKNMDRSRVIFGNPMDPQVIKKAEKTKAGYEKKFGSDEGKKLGVRVSLNPVLGEIWGLKTIHVGPWEPGMEETLTFPPEEKPLIIGTIRMGYGHFRISMAMASAARSQGFTPYWFDMHSFSDTTGGKIIRHLNGLYSLGSRLSQKYPLFNKLYWEPLNSQGFRQLSYNAVDQKVSELMAPVCRLLPRDVPFVATHVWPAQAAVHAGLTRVVNVIPDNWPMALHLAEGSLHAVQTPFAWWGYKTLGGMDGRKHPLPMPEGTVMDAGHYLDHEFVANLADDCKARIARREAGAPLRLLASIGGAGAQKDYLLKLMDLLRPEISSGKIILWINAGDHTGVRDALVQSLMQRNLEVTLHQDWDRSKAFDPQTPGNHLFCHEGIFEAVYLTNILIRSCDLLATKPSELAFYPVPKLLIKRIGGHEAWGAIRSSDLGDGTPELENPREAAVALRLMLADAEVLTAMNQAILKAGAGGTYSGAYRVVEVAAGARTVSGKT